MCLFFICFFLNLPFSFVFFVYLCSQNLLLYYIYIGDTLMKRLTLLSLAALSMAANAQILRTTVAQGDIEGEQLEGSVLYKAIPYAEPPVGKLRWKAPVPKAPWTGTYKATDWGARPYQQVDPNQNGGALPMSEDCLYLSVQTPAKTTADKLPVFVNIHGGAFATGSYSGTLDSFVREGIIYVSIEYRLGALGFMAHPELSKESPDGISGNYGIYDQICALQWVHDNIAAFGGDPEKVTICGESAGGISVSILCASPLCKGLFRGAISESGGNFCPVSKDSDNPMGRGASMTTCKEAEARGTNFQQRLGVKNMKQMLKIDGDSLVRATQGTEFWPVVDGKAIVGDQYSLYKEGRYNDVDVIVGYNSDEGSLFVYNYSLDAYNKTMAAYGEWEARAREAYPATNDREALYAMQDIFRDTAFGWGTWAWANLQSRTGKSRVYMYYFDQKSGNIFMTNTRGATHVAEMPFIYDWHWGPMNDIDTHMAQIMPQYWMNFVKHGNPNADCLPFWTTYREGEPTVMNMHNGFSLTPAPNAVQMRFWEDLFGSLR